jgi:hypothetical protein
VLTIGYDGLGTVFDLNCLRLSAICGEVPFWREGSRGGERKIGGLGALTDQERCSSGRQFDGREVRDAERSLKQRRMGQ